MYKTGLSALALQELNTKGFASKADAIKPFKVTRGCKVFDGNYINIDTLPAIGTFGKQGFVSVRDYIDTKTGGSATTEITKRGRVVAINEEAIIATNMWNYPILVRVDVTTAHIFMSYTDNSPSGRSANFKTINIDLPDEDLSVYDAYIEVSVDGVYIGSGLQEAGGLFATIPISTEGNNGVVYNDLCYLIENGVGCKGQVIVANITLRRKV